MQNEFRSQMKWALSMGTDLKKSDKEMLIEGRQKSQEKYSLKPIINHYCSHI